MSTVQKTALTSRQYRSMLISAVFAAMFMGITYSWTIYRPYLEAAFGYNATQTSMTFSLTIAFYCIGGFFGSRIVQRIGAKVVARMSAALILAGLLIMSQLESFPDGARLAAIYLAYGMICGFGIGIGYNLVVGFVTPWYTRHFGVVSGVLLAAYGTAGTVFSLVFDQLIRHFTVFQIFIIFGAAAFLVIFVFSFFVRIPPSAAAGREERVSEEPDPENYTPKEAFRSVSFWIIFIWNIIITGACLTVVNNVSTIAAAFGATTTAGMIVLIANGCGRILWGFIVERINRLTGTLVLALLIVLSSVLFIIAAQTGSTGLMMAAIIIIGFDFGCGGVQLISIVRSSYGLKHFAKIYSSMIFCALVGALLGPILSGMLQDGSSGLMSTFIMLLVFGIADVVLTFVMELRIRAEVAQRVGMKGTR